MAQFYGTADFLPQNNCLTFPREFQCRFGRLALLRGSCPTTAFSSRRRSSAAAVAWNHAFRRNVGWDHPDHSKFRDFADLPLQKGVHRH
jgi:hypothetical protein